LLSDDGALSPLHPASPYWPYVDLGVPVRIRLRRAEDGFARTVSDGWGTADSGQAWTASGGAPSDYSVSAGVATHSHTTVNHLRRTVLATTLVDVEQVVDVATSAMLTGAALVTGVLARYQDSGDHYWLRVEFDADSADVQLKITKSVGGQLIELAALD